MNLVCRLLLEKKSLHFWVEMGTVFLKKLGSDLVAQSSRYGYPAQNFALYHLGMVPGGKVFEGGRLGGYSCFPEGPQVREKNSLNFSVKIWTVLLKKLGSDLVVQSSR